ncbi:MAG: bifunctional riboflavin kinase/FAD synthetase [Spirochaetia bacterium]|nr:bifunctional riboflavin kinase/FAD synthetase [Spirochaetia bacterium]
MNVIYDLDHIKKSDLPGVVTLGNFDGIHLGHKKIITRCIEEAKTINGPSIVVSYDHQRSAIFKDHREFITSTAEKIEILQNLGVDILILIPFSEKVKNMRADEFLKELLIHKLNTRIIVIGYDHHFGKNREGNIHYLKNRADEFNYKVIQIEPVYYMDRIISSSRIRSDLVMGDIKKINEQLGSQYQIFGKVVKGFQRGNITGFPTANIQISDNKLLPIDGVYYGIIKIPSQNITRTCVINIGKNPTFNNNKLSVEVHILDFAANIYDTPVQIYFVGRLRDEKKFDNIENLKIQIKDDIEIARTFFKALF